MASPSNKRSKEEMRRTNERPARVLMLDLLSEARRGEARQNEAKGASILFLFLYLQVRVLLSDLGHDSIRQKVWIRLTR